MRNLQAATQALQQFQQQVQQQTGGTAQQFTRTSQAIQQFTQQLTQLNQQASSQAGFFGQMSASLGRLEQSLQQTTRATQQSTQSTSAWTQALSVAAGIGIATTLTGMVSALSNFVSQSVQLAAQMQDLHRSFVALEGSGGAANRTMEGLFQTAQRAGVGFREVAEGFRRLEAGAKGTTLSQDDLKRAMDGIVTGARVMGVSTQQSQQALVAWEQILTKGKLSSEELVRQLGNAVPGGLNIVARSLGTTTAQLRAMAEGGIIPGTLAFVAFGEEMRKIGASAGPIEGLSATFARLKNETLAWMTAIGESIGAVLEPFLDKITEISEALRKLLGIRGPGETAPGTGLAEPGGAMNARTQFPLAASAFTEQIVQAAVKQRLDPGLLSQVMRVESGFNPTAVSRAGAVGLGQLMPATAAELEPGTTAEQLKEPERNLRLAARYLRQQLDKFRQFSDQVKLALAAYNAGPGTVEDLLLEESMAGRPQTYAGIEARLPRETQQYVARVTDVRAGQAAAGTGLNAEAQAKIVEGWKKEIAETLEITKNLQAQIDAIAQSSGRVGTVMDKDIAQAAARLVDRFSNLQQAFATLPQLANQLPQSLREQVTEATKQAAVWQETLMTDTRRRDLLRQQVEAVEQLTIRRQAELVALRQGEIEAERFTRLETARLQQERLADAPRRAGLTPQQQIAEYEQRLVALQNRAAEFGTQLEAARAEAMRPGLESQLTRIEDLMGRPGQSLAQRAATQMQEQFAAARVELERLLRDVSRNPALQDFAERIQNALAGLGEAATRETESAFARTDTAMRDRITGIGDQITQITMKLDAAGLSPLQQALEQLKREFQAMLDTLDRLQARLGEEFLRATPERQEEIKALVDQINAARDRLPAARMEQLQERELRPQTQYLDRLRQQLDQAQTAGLGQATLAGDPRLEYQLRRLREPKPGEEEMTLTPAGQAEAEDLEKQIRAQARLNYEAGLFVEVANSVGSAWSNALQSIADGTATVGEAFKAMARSILQSMAQIASQEATKAFIGLGLRLLFGAGGAALGGGAAPTSTLGGAAGYENTSFVGGTLGTGPEATSLFGGLQGFQHGGMVNRRQLALLGENPSLNPEYILNRPQMSALMQAATRAAPSAGGQAAGVSIHNYPSKQAAEEGASRDRAMGRQAILNEVLGDVSQGEGSRLVRALRTVQR